MSSFLGQSILSSTRTGRITSRLTRITTTGQFIPEIDGLRFVAIVLVLLFHINGYLAARMGFGLDNDHQVLAGHRNVLTYVVAHGDVGVPLFFVISGFILALPFARHALGDGTAVSIRRYFARRLTRLEPPYLAALLISLLALLIFFRTAGSPLTTVGLLQDAALNGVYLHNLVTGQFSDVNIALWSLEVEVQFYLLAPLLALVFYIPRVWQRRGALIGAMLLAGGVQPLLRDLHPGLVVGSRVGMSLAGQLQYFLAGFVLAEVFVARWGERPPAGGRLATLVMIVGWPMLFLMLSQRFIEIRHLILPPMIILLYVAVLTRARGSRWLAWPAVTVIGGMCYSIYLLHMPIMYGVGRLTRRIGVIGDSFTVTFLVQAVLLLMAMIGVASVFYILVERPCMDRSWPGKLLGLLRLRSTAAPSRRVAPATATSRDTADASA